MRHKLLAAVFSFTTLGAVPLNHAVADDGWAAWKAVSTAEMSYLRGGTSSETVNNQNEGSESNGTTITPSVDEGNAALQIVKNEIAGSVGDTGSINSLTVDGQLNVNAINTGNNNTMLNQLTVIVDMDN